MGGATPKGFRVWGVKGLGFWGATPFWWLGWGSTVEFTHRSLLTLT